MSLRISLLVLCFIVAVAGVYKGKGYYCRDPDTGKLHPINATWTSTTFCGSYTCKLRKKNNTETRLPSIHADIDRDIEERSNTGLDQKAVQKKNCSQDMAEESSNVAQELRKDDNVTYINLENFKETELGTSIKDGDRYLTEEEIRALTLLLHTMRKSDLEAIIEIYNLAQEIYKEIDKATEMANENTRKSHQDESLLSITERTNLKDHNLISYWYEPLSSTVHRQKLVDTHMPAPILPSNLKETQTIVNNIEKSKFLELPSVRPVANSQAYFGTSLSQNDFKKLPYYYPVSNFQKKASYVHPQPQPQHHQPAIVSPLALLPNSQQLRTSEMTIDKTKCCKHNDEHIKNSPWYQMIKNPYLSEPAKPINDDRKPKASEPKINQVFPYPFAYLQYNMSSTVPNNNIVLNRVVDNPWAFFNMPKYHQNQPYINTAYVAQVPNGYLVAPNVVHEIEDVYKEKSDKRTSSEETRDILEDWQTAPLSANVINEVRSNTEAKLLPFPFRKKIKLESVENLMRLEDILRIKRDAKIPLKDPEDFEVYIEKSTCITDTKPGFFKVGNTSQPFPACCPQRIS